MKRLILILILLVSTAICKEHYNPNGRPYTLNISIVNAQTYDLSIWDDVTVKGVLNFDINMPLNNMLTLKIGFYEDAYYSHDGAGVPLEETIARWGYAGLDLHLPLYKLWEK